MQLRHERDGAETVLASRVETADSFLSRARGLMFRRSVPDDYALAFRFDGAAIRDVHMLFVPFPLDVLWVVEGEVTHRARLRPWLGFERAKADTLLELPAGAAEDVRVGDRVEVVAE